MGKTSMIFVKKLFLVFIFILMFIPVYFMAIGGFQNIVGIMKMPPDLIPNNPTLHNYEVILKWPLLKWLSNSIIVTISTVILTVLLCSSAGYSFAFYTWKFKELLWGIIMVGLMVPRISFIIPTFVIIKKMNLSGSLVATIIPNIYNCSLLYMTRVYFETIPKSLLESARLDGANEVQILWHIVMPMSKPIIAALALFSAIGSLGDYLWQMLVLQRPENQTLIVGMIMKIIQLGNNTIQGGMNPFSLQLAVGTILLIPLLVIFLLSNKYFTQNIGGAIKE
jgi:ABC-type glycerol-3-phosphate transport system permease component